MIPREIIEKIRRIEIVSRRRVNDMVAGQYHSVFKGQGMEFTEVREYNPGDDVRNIDWNVTARTGMPHIKNFQEERELTVLFLVDVSASGTFGSVNQAKGELAAELTAVLAFSAISNNDRVGLIAFSDRIEQFIPPRKGRGHVLRLVRDILFHQPESKGTDIAAALEYCLRVQKKKAIVFLLSDFFDKGYERALGAATKRYDLIAGVLTDPRDREFPEIGLLALEDPETGETALVDTSDPSFGKYLKKSDEQQAELRQQGFRKLGVDSLLLSTDKPYERELMRFFKNRERRKSH